VIEITDEMIEEARKTIAKGEPQAVGYRLAMYTIDATDGLEESQVEQFETLASKGFTTKTKDQQERESRGSHYGILLSMGDHVFAGDLGGVDVWGIEEGDLLIFDRYAGVQIEMPPGSGQMIRFTNDESVLGKMRKPE